MVKSRLLVTGILVVLFFFIVVPQGTAAQGKDRGKKDGKKAAEFIPGEILVKFKPGVSSLVRQKVHDKFKAKVVKRSTKLGIERVKLPAGAKIAEILEQYRRNSNVEFAEPNYIFHADWTPDDPGYPDQWGLPKINTPQAWDITRGSTTVKVAVVDTGVDLNHPDLQANLVGGYNAINGGSAQDDNGHGTHVAGIIAAVTNNGIGVAGVAPQVKIIPVKVLDANGSGYLSDVAEGIRWAADNGADVINLSLGASVDTYTMREAINYAYNKGVVIVAAAGNDYRGTVNYPAANDHVIGVSATDSEDFLAYFSNIGPQVDVAAPGLNILSTYWYQSSSTYAFLDGTSMATPFVAGLAALIRSQNDSLTPDQVEGKIKAAAVDLGAPGKDDVYGYGRIDAYRALGNPPPGDVWEDNDTAGQAPLLNDGITLNPTFYPAGDQDWFKINTSTGKLVIDVLPSSEADAIVEVYDSGLSLVGQADTTGSGGREHLSLSGLSSGNYYLKIYEAGGNSFSNPYTLAVSTVGDGQENNNVALMASAVTSGQTIYPTLNPAGDEDWFSIYAHEPGDLTVSVQPPSNMDAAIRIYDSNLNRLTTIDSYYEGGSESGTVSLLQGGTYYIQVYDYFNAQSNGSYAFTATYTDTTKPVISNVSDGPDPFLAAHNASNISFTLSEEAFVTVKIYAGSTLVKTLLNNSLRGAGSHSVSWDGTNNLGYRLPDGLYTYKINATDLAGNVADEVSGTIYLDKSIPEISNLRVTPSIFSPVIGDATINYELSEESLVSLIVEDLSGNPVRVLLDNVRQAAGSQNAYWDGNNDSGGRVSDGEYILRVEAVDLRGNPSDAVNASVVVDGTPPGVESIYPADGATSISLNSSIKVIFSEEIDISSLNVSTFTLFAAGTPVSGLVSYDAALKQAVFTPFTSLEENTWYSVVLDGVIKDLAGNSLGQPYTWSFRTADLTSPQTAVVSPVEGSALKDQVTLKASVRDGGGIKEVYFEYSADGSNWMTLPGTAVLREGTVLEGLWEYTWEVTGLPENVYIRVKAIDLGGNTGYSQPVFYQVLQSNEVMVDTGGGEYNFEQGQVKLIIPPDAFASQTRIRVSKVDQNGTVAPPSGYRLVGAVYDFTAETEFNSPVTVVFKYNPEELGDAVEEALKVYYLKPTTNKWEPVGGKVNTVTHTVTVELEHFSQYALLAPEKRYYLATPTRDVYGNSYFNPDNFTNYPYEIYLPNETDPASYRIHTSYTRDTDACASCHRTHTAVGPGLLQWYTIYDTCMACHDGTVKTTYNVVEGKIADTGRRTSGGKFGLGKESYLSRHNVKGTLNIASAPGGSTITVYEENEDGSIEPVSWGIRFGCESCHNPHGLGGNARILNPDPNGWARRNKKTYYPLTAVNEESTVFVAYPEQDTTRLPYYMLTGYEYGVITYVYDEFNNVEIAQPTIDNSRGYTRIVFDTPQTGKQIKATFFPSLRVIMDIDGYLTANETITYQDGTSEFCGACHTDYYTASTTKTSSGRILTGTYSRVYRHQIGVKDTESPYEFSELLKYETDQERNRKLICLTCHTAHGVDQEYWQQTIDPDRTYGDYWQQEDHTKELAGSSALKRMPNMATCEACHQKAEANEGYLANSGQKDPGSVSGNTADYFTLEGAEYVSAQTCKFCHRKRYDEWKITLHANMVKEVTSLDTSGILTTAKDNWSVELSTYYGQPEDVAYTLGSKWKQMYVFKNGTLGYRVATGNQVVWDVKEAKWESYRPGETVDWDDTCIACYVTGFNGNTGENVIFQDHGIGCESCHGPGSKHSKHPGEGNIINPGKLDQDRAIEVCGQCHARGINKDGVREDAYGFIPGQILAETFTVLDKINDDGTYFWPDGTAKGNHMQYQDFLLSKHYLTGIMTCNTCHDSHGLSDDGRPLKLTLQQTCGTCHGQVLDIDRYMPYTAVSINEYDIRSHAFKEDYFYPAAVDNPSLD